MYSSCMQNIAPSRAGSMFKDGEHFPSFSTPCPGSTYTFHPRVFARIVAPGLPGDPGCAGTTCEPMFPPSFTSEPTKDACTYKGHNVVYTVQTPRQVQLVPCIVSNPNDISTCTLPGFKTVTGFHTGSELTNWVNQHCQISTSPTDGIVMTCDANVL